MHKEGSSLEVLRKERDDARSERDALKKQVDKLTYQGDRTLDLDVAASLARSIPEIKAANMSVAHQEEEKELQTRLTSFFSAPTTADDELELIAAFLAASRESQRLCTQKLLSNLAVANFSILLQFFVRIIMAAHARSHRDPDHTPEQEMTSVFSCSYEQNVAQSCIMVEQKEPGVASRSVSVSFSLPTSFHSCLSNRYGSVERLKCEEVWHGDHMAYRCKTCGLSDSSCMCLTCFDLEQHEGHDFRVYRCSSGGCCDCGDPLAWKPEGFCKKHSAREETTGQRDRKAMPMNMDPEEDTVVHMLVQKCMEFCAGILHEVYAACLRPRAMETTNLFYPRWMLPRPGSVRAAFPPIVREHIDRLQHILVWLQILSMSCLHYRNVISAVFFETLPAQCQLNVVTTQNSTSSTDTSCQPIEVGLEKTVQGSGLMNEEKMGNRFPNRGPLVILDIFLEAGILLPLETCDVLGVLYLKLLFDQTFKQLYSCHFLEWYPYFVELYLAANEDNNEDGMRNLSRFIDRLFCQLFHSNAQLRELETVFASRRLFLNIQEKHGTCCHRRRQSHLVYDIPDETTDAAPASSCVEWLMVFMLKKLNELFCSTFQLMTNLPQPSINRFPSNPSSSNGICTSTVGLEIAPESPPVLRTVQTVDCGRNVFKKRIYARLCSDLRTLLVHPQVVAEVLLKSFRCIGENECALHETSVYAQLIKVFELLQQMDLQTCHVHRHIEFESQNWTCAFVADYELKLLLSAFLTGIPACFSREVWQSITTRGCVRNQGVIGVITGSTPLNPLETNTFREVALARAILQPLRTALAHWAGRKGRPVPDENEFVVAHGDATATSENTTITQLVKSYEQGSQALEGATVKSFHYPLHHMYAALVHALCGVVRPQTLEDWRELLGMSSTPAENWNDLAFWYRILDHTLRVLFFSREIKAGYWVRNGGAMLQQMTHYHSRHWRYFGLHSDLFICQLGACFLPHGSFIRLFFNHLPLRLRDSLVLGLSSLTVQQMRGIASSNAEHSRELRQELDVVEEALRLILQLVLTPVKLASSSSPETAALWLLEREMMHWLSLGPFPRSEVIMRTDSKLVEQIKQLPALDLAQLEEEEILTHVLEKVGVYHNPAESGCSSRTARSRSRLGCGLRMNGSWKLKPELWSRISPLFECFTPSEAQQCEQNIRKNLSTSSGHDSSSSTFAVQPILPRAQFEGKSSVDMHGLIAETMLNSSYMTSVLFIVFENFKRKLATQSQRERGDSKSRVNECSVSNENVLLAALHCLYVAVEMLPEETQSKCQETSGGFDHVGHTQNVDDIATYFDEKSSFFVKLCTEIPLQCNEQNGNVAATSSLLLLLLFFAEHKSKLEDSYPVVNKILVSVRAKSPTCLKYLEALKHKKLNGLERHCIEGSESDNSSECPKNEDKRDEQSKRSAKEMMKRRQQQILEMMRSQQTHFLCSNGDAMVDNATDCHDLEGSEDLKVETDSDSFAEVVESDDDVEVDHEEDEWGFPTGQIDLRLYMDHVTCAIAQLSEKQRRNQERRRRQRRRTWSSSLTAGCSEKGRISSIGSNHGSMDESLLQTEECGLCRLPCDEQSRDLSFGFVGMILPTNMLQKMENSSCSSAKSTDVRLEYSRLSSLRVLKPGSTDEMRLQLADIVIWSCGHAIHHACLKAYITSLWNANRGHSHKDRLLSERDREFLCPICRRLSNCLVPRVSLDTLRERVSSTDCDLQLDNEPNESDDGQDPLVFLQWLDTQMSFRDDSPVVKRRRSRTLSSLRQRRRLLSLTSRGILTPSSQGDNDSSEQDVSVEREIGAFCHEIVSRSVRAQMYLPTLLSDSLDDESRLELEMQRLSSECGAQAPAWQWLLHCFEVQLRVVAREQMLLQTEVVDLLQLRSMRQVADMTAAAVAFSAPCSLAWSVAETSAEKQFDSVMTRLNGLIFGQQVLFEEDEEAESTTSDQQWSRVEEMTDAVLVGTPMLCHPRLLTCFTMRMIWRQSLATPNAKVATEQLMTEAFFSARIIFTAQVLQSLASLSMQARQETVESGETKKSQPTIRDFEEVESLRDACAWISLMLARSRLVDSTLVVVPPGKDRNTWNSATLEEQVSVLCLPLAQQMLLLMDVILPRPHPHPQHDTREREEFQASKLVESCAVCDGLFVSPRSSTDAPSACVLLENCLRRLHLPPLRLFFHRQMFPSSQRALCQLWGAQLEAKAAVSRQQARSRTLKAGGSPCQREVFPLQRQVIRLSTRAHAALSAGTSDRLLISLPRMYMDLFIRYNEKPLGICPQCAQAPQNAGLCLLCGHVLCCFSACCEVKAGAGIGEGTHHAQRCGLGVGAILLLRACTVILFLGNERRCVWGSLYVDKNGEEDPYLRRGKTLYLDETRHVALETLLVSHSFSQNTAILQNTSRRDGRRY
ncbi:hypothetical protein PsorP6_001483 [Peronosclerospora sorghi]|uniref:Uncharacterized protein n=1 Tax=Peronosclerospora sorghi TaxID=230839 RepID=A0ACC0WXE8_9STRA|nr:hypothetical protein PsorP6_001483 [Peronosclerospora sorghi]